MRFVSWVLFNFPIFFTAVLIDVFCGLSAPCLWSLVFFRRVTRLDEMRYWFIELLGMNHNDDDYPYSPAISLGFPLALRFTFSIC
jgi:hypothetical protein